MELIQQCYHDLFWGALVLLGLGLLAVMVYIIRARLTVDRIIGINLIGTLVAIIRVKSRFRKEIPPLWVIRFCYHTLPRAGNVGTVFRFCPKGVMEVASPGLGPAAVLWRCGGIAHLGHCGTWLENRNLWRGATI